MPAESREIVSSREFDSPREKLFEAFTDPEKLARWWGPNGFANTIRKFEPKAGGAWQFTMRGPDGTEYENECLFAQVAFPHRIVYLHLEPMHRFEMEMDFEVNGAGSRLTWTMQFDSAEELEPIREFLQSANEQNFDRLQAELNAAAAT